MAGVATLLERRQSVVALRRALPRAGWPLFVGRSPAHLATLLHRHCLEAIIIGHEVARSSVLDALRRDYPGMPLILYLPVRSDDADLLRRAHRERVAAVAVEGLDEPILPRLLVRHSLTARRLADLLPLAGRLDLTDDLQRRAWALIIALAPRGLDTVSLARRLDVRRETLSRRFAAGAAPSLKRAIDAVRLVAAAQLLGNPGYNVADAARLLGFSSVSLLQQTARRTFGVSARAVATLDAERMASRLSDRGTVVRWR
jgi:AraC-like DNA-binding protein